MDYGACYTPGRLSRLATLAASLSILGGCALHDWSDYSGGAVAGPADGGSSIAEAGVDATTPPGTDGGALDSYGAVVAADAPRTWYRFEDAAGATTLADETRARDARVNGATATLRQPGVAGNAMQLGGQTTLDLGDVYAFEGKASFSLELWIKTRGTGEDQRLFYKRDDGLDPSVGYVMYLGGDGSPHFEVSPVSMSTWGNKAIPANEFVHLVVVVSYETGKGNATLWVNGARVENYGYDNTMSLPRSAVPLTIGDHVEGVVDELAIYDRPLGQARILQHYLAGIAR